MTSRIIACLFVALMIFGSFVYISFLNEKNGRLAEEIKTLLDQKAVLISQVEGIKNACDARLAAIKKLEIERKAAANSVEPFLIQLDELSKTKTEPTSGKSDDYVNRLNGLNRDLNRLLERNSQ